MSQLMMTWKNDMGSNIENLHNKEIASITWIVDGKPQTLYADNTELRFDVAYCGDRHELWVLQINHGKEMNRFNYKYISDITWKQS